ncbi:MAG: IPT/TIG domain-containing protein [Actinobacteria bacterium]|nr:IPT/TIG domain-containing protein [Actinomycetota bacterium]MBU1942505.1 IPT/TIG domain-containing protein [Actinomycetota bacterium]MBU2687233.1 IPT/TIG domain-containing protein [Actinomycetota bacterium]
MSGVSLLLVVMLAVVMSIPALAAPSSWTAQRTNLIQSDFGDVSFLPGATQGWAVGSPYFDGANLRHCWYTADGGNSWTAQTIGDWVNVPALILAEMKAVHFRNANLGYTVGQFGLISKCTDGAAGTWAVVRQGSYTEVLQDIICPSDTEVWVVGVDMITPGVPATYSPVLLHSTDAGANWSTANLNETSFANDTDGWAVGDGGVIIHTLDGGVTWALQTSGVTTSLNAVEAVSASEAWIAGENGTILHTLDAGATWTGDFGTSDVFMFDATHVWVTGQEGLMLFYDGTGWTRQLSGSYDDLNAVCFVDANYGWAVGENGRSIYTTNGGAIWNALGGVADDLNDVCVFDDTAGPSLSYLIWTCGDGGALYLTADAAPGGGPGAWVAPAVTPPPVQDLFGIDFENATDGWVCGTSGTLASTGDGGNTWDNTAAPAGIDFKDVTWTGDAGKWFAVSADGGMWQTRLSDTWGRVDLNDVAYPNANWTYYVGGGGAIVAQNHVAGTWTVQDSTTSADLLSCEFPDFDHGWIGGKGTVLYTQNGGTTWNAHNPAAATDWNDVSVILDGGTYYTCAVGDGGNIVHTTDDGATPPAAWQLPQWAPPGNPDLEAVSFINKDVGWALGEDGTVWQTLDGSATNPTWETVNLNDTFALDASNMYFVGDGGTIINWNATAQTVTLQFNAGAWTTEDLNAVYFADPTSGWAVGSNGTVIECIGGTWQAPAQVGGANPALNDVCLSAVGEGYAVGDTGYYTHLTGGAWGAPAQVGAVTNPDLYAVDLSGASDGWAVGDSGYYTQLAADVWSEPAQVGGANPVLNSIWLTAADAGFAVGDSGYHVELAAGAWNAPAQVGGDNPDLYDLTYPAGTDGWSVGGNGTNGYRVPIASGVYGTPEMVPGNARELDSVSFYAEGYGVAAGDFRTVVSYNITGTNWEINSGIGATTEDFLGFDVPLSTQWGVGVGTNGLAYILDGGFFTQTDPATTNDLHAVDALDTDEACAVGKVGVFSRYTGSWTASAAGTTSDLYGVEFVSSSTGAVAGAGRLMEDTATGGSSWTAESGILKTTNDLLSLDFGGASDGWVCGEGGGLYRYEDGRIFPITTPNTLDLRGVGVFDNGGTLLGFSVGDKRIVLADDGGGLTTESLAQTTADLNGSTFPAQYHGWFAGSGNFILEYDSGLFLPQTVGTGYDYLDVSLVDQGGGVYSGAAVGEGGDGSYTGDGGDTWSDIQNVGTAEDLNGVDVQSATAALLVGNNGVLKRSIDGGSTWDATVTTPPVTTEDLNAVGYADANYAWLAGDAGVVFNSTNGGDDWAAQTSGTTHDLLGFDAYFDGVDYDAWAVGRCRTILSTNDGGGTWTPRSLVPTPGGLMGADYIDGTNWYAVGLNTATGGEILHTTDGGATFTVEATGLPDMYAVEVGDPANVWAAGDAGTIMYWNGAAWAPQAIVGPDFRDISMAWDGAAYCGAAVGEGLITSLYTINGGAGWTPSAINVNKNTLYGVHTEHIAGPLYFTLAVGDSGTMMLSPDSGNNFAFARGPANVLNGVSFVNGTVGWACGSRGTIIFTNDGGVTWTALDSTTTTDLNAISALDLTHIYCVGDDGEILFSNDGLTWAAMASGTANDLMGVHALDAANVWAVGATGTILYYNGAWADQSPGGEDLNAVGIFDGTHGWAVGDAGTVHYFDGGAWTPQTSGTGENLNGVRAESGDHAWAVGTAGTIINTTDGASWSQQSSGTDASLFAVGFDGSGHPDERNGWVVGEGEELDEEAVILSTDNGGSSWVKDTSNTGVEITLRALDLSWNAGSGNWDAVTVGDWGRVQTLSLALAQPAITSISTSVGPVGTALTIDGTDFGAEQATVHGHVYFNPGIEASVSTWTDTQLTLTVPAGAYGYQEDLFVVNDGGSSAGEPFTVTPHIDSATSPVTGGDTVVVAGSGFGADPGAGNRSSANYHVDLGGTWVADADVTSWTDTEIQFTVANDVLPGSAVGVTVVSGDPTNQSNTLNIQVNPNVTGLSINSCYAGDTVTINGTNFGTDPGGGYDDNNCVRLNNMDEGGNVAEATLPVANVNSWSDSAIEIDVPDIPAVFQPWTGEVKVRRSFAASQGGPTLTVLPHVDNLSATEVSVGDTLTIFGTVFGEVQGGSGHVFINGVEPSTYILWSYNEVRVIVPETTGGPVTVQTVAGTSNNDVTVQVVPTIGSLSANHGRVGDAVTVTGTGFGPAQGGSTVSFNGVDAAVISWGANSITATVPDTATTGNVVVTVDALASNGLPFAVWPKITGLDPTSGVPGTTVVTIDGFTFGDTQGTSTVTFNDVDAGAAESWSSTRLRVRVPAGASTGNVVVTSPDGPSNGRLFSVGPQIDGIDPSDGPPDSEVTLTGSNFGATRGSSTVTFNGVAAGSVGSWSDTSIKVDVPEGAETGDVKVTTSQGTSNAVQFNVGLSHVYYFAEGTTRPNFEEWLCLMNPNTSDVTVNITYMKGDGTTKDQQVDIPKTSRTTLFVPDAVGPDQDVSAKVECSKPIMAERPMYFNFGGAWTGGHDVVGAIAPLQDWYFAEGTTRDGFCEYLCLQNPGTAAAEVAITYMLGTGETKVQTVSIDPTSRQTVDVRAFLGPNADCSAYIHSDTGIIAERPMYFIYKPGSDNWTGGHDVVGASSPRTEWFFAEGTTRDGFDEWLCLQNPGPSDAVVNIVYMLGTGDNKTQVVTVPSFSRKTLDVVNFLGRGQDVSMTVKSDQPIVAERPMYFDYAGLTGGSDVVGATFSCPHWYFAEGATQYGFQEYLSVQNPNAEDISVTITYMLGTGENIDKSVVVKANSRATVDVNGEVGWGQDVSAELECSADIIVERPMYFNYRGVWTGGHDVVGFHY